MARKQRKLATCDAETDPFSEELRDNDQLPQPFLWGYFDGTDYYEFDTTDKFVEFIGKQYVRCYAHNGGKFDFHYLLEYAGAQGVKIINGRIAEFRIGNAILADSYLVLPVPLAEHSKDEIEYWKFHKDVRRLYRAEISGYLENDCCYLYDFIQRFSSEYPLKTTLASSSMAVWKKQFDGRVDKTNKRFYERFKTYYFGGRCEAFKKGVMKGDFTVIDLNSAYPDAMTHDHPAGDKYDSSETLPNSESQIRRSFISGTCYSRGALPVRDRTGGVAFPHGKIEFHCTGHELLAAMETKTISELAIREVRTFHETVNYKAYVMHFYAKKLEAERTGDKTGRLYAKLFMNVLYGKNAANPEKYKEWWIDEYGMEMADEWDSGPIFGSKQMFNKPLDEEKHRYYNLATAASITGMVRATLWKSICNVDVPYYCDTDAIIYEGEHDLILGDGLGQWAVEGRAEELAIAGKKLYAMFTDKKWWKTEKQRKEAIKKYGTERCIKMACKGVRLKAYDIKKVAKGETVNYHSIVPSFSLSRKSGYISRDISLT